MTPSETAAALLNKAQTSGSGAIIILPMRPFGGSEMVALSTLLDNEQTVTELRASGKHIGSDGARAMGALLGGNRCALLKLAIGGASFGVDGELEQLSSALVEAGGECLLQELDLSFKALCGASVASLSGWLARSPNLKAIDLSRNPNLDTGGIAALWPALCGCKHLSKLVLSECSLAATDWLQLAAAPTALQTLHLSENALAHADFAVLLRAVPSLTCLKLCACELGDAAARSLGRALRDFARELRELRLDDNPLLLADECERGLPLLGLPHTFIESSLPSRADFLASLRLTDVERVQVEKTAAARAAAAMLAKVSADETDDALASVATAPAAYALACGLAASPSLTALGLGGCRLTDAMAVTLGGAMAPLTEVNAKSSLLSAHGAAALMRLPALERLVLFDCPTVACAAPPPNEEGVAQADARGGTRAAGNGVGEAHAPTPLALLVGSLASCRRLQHLDLGTCALSTDALRMLRERLSGHGGSAGGTGSDAVGAPSLRCLELFGNGEQVEGRPRARLCHACRPIVPSRTVS